MTRAGRPSLLRRARRCLGHVAALVYLAACVLAFVWALVVSSEGSMAFVIPILVTAPAGLVLLFTLPEGTATFFLSLVLGALVNAIVIGWCARVLSRGGKADPAS